MFDQHVFDYSISYGPEVVAMQAGASNAPGGAAELASGDAVPLQAALFEKLRPVTPRRPGDLWRSVQKKWQNKE